jgi:hypothetical protein
MTFNIQHVIESIQNPHNTYSIITEIVHMLKDNTKKVYIPTKLLMPDFMIYPLLQHQLPYNTYYSVNYFVFENLLSSLYAILEMYNILQQYPDFNSFSREQIQVVLNFIEKIIFIIKDSQKEVAENLSEIIKKWDMGYISSSDIDSLMNSFSTKMQF